MNESLIKQIEDLLRKLEEQRAKMTQVSSTSRNYDIAIQSMRDNLRDLGDSASLSKRQVDDMTSAVNRFYTAIQLGSSKDVRLTRGARVGAGAFYGVKPAIDAETTAALAQYVETPASGSTLKSRQLDDARAAKLQAEQAKAARAQQAKENEDLKKEIRARQVVVNESIQSLNRLATQYKEAIKNYFAAMRSRGSASQTDVNATLSEFKAALAQLTALETELNLLKGKGGISPKSSAISENVSKSEQAQRAAYNAGIAKDRKQAEREAAQAARTAAREQARADREAERERFRLERERLANEARARTEQNRARRQAEAQQRREEREAQRQQQREQREAQREQRRADAQAARDQARAETEAQRQREEAARTAEANQARANLGSSIPGGQKGADNLNRRAQAVDADFTPETIKRVDTVGGAFTKVTYQVKTAEGVFKSATFVVDKFGNVLLDTQRRFQNFGTGLARDIRELAKWSIAVALIYGPMQKLGELTSLMIKNEATLADITITLGNAQKSTNEVFQAAADIAELTGESLDGVLEAYNLAYRAAGGAASETERFATANKLLTDAIILSKLSTLDQAESIDILAAALKQTNQPLSNGTELLNKWVAITKEANVDMATLATGFSVVGDAAESVGLKADELNAVIATIAETSNQTGKEVANTARALVAGFQSDQGKKVLESFGISTEFEGQARSFLEVAQQIVSLKKQGLIDETQFGKLTLALGGGTRRQAAFATFFENFDKVDALTKLSAAAGDSSEAFDALEQQTGTVQTAITRLDSAFQGLAQALGEDGGILDLMRGIINVAADMVNGMTSLTETFGRAVPAVMALVTAFLLLRNSGVSETIGNMAGGLSRGLSMIQFRKGTPIGPMDSTSYEAMQNKSFAASSSAQRWAGSAVGAAMALAPAAQRLGSGDVKGAGRDFAGVAAGALIGTLVAPGTGTVIGANIGGAIVEGMLTAGENYKPQFQDIFNPVYNDPTKPETPTEKNVQQIAEEKAVELLKQTTGTTAGWLGAFKTGFYNLAGSMVGTSTKDNYRGGPVDKSNFNTLTDTQALLVDLEFKRQTGAVTQEEYDLVIKAFQEAASYGIQEAAKDADFTKAFGTDITNVQKYYQNEIQKKLLSGDMGVAPYRQSSERLNNFGTSSNQYYSAIGQDFGGTSSEFFNMAGRITAYASDDELKRLTELTTAINQLTVDMTGLTAGTDKYNEKLNKKNELTAQAVAYANLLNQQVLAEQSKLLNSTNLTDYKPDERQAIIERAKIITKQPLVENKNAGGLTLDEFNASVEKLPDSLVVIGDTATKVAKTSKDAFSEAISQLTEEGKIAQQSLLGFSTYNVSKEKLASVVNGPEYKNMSNQLIALGYKLDEQTDIAITNEGSINTYKKDWKIVQYLLQQIEENTSKLDGAYNLPEGAGFWVPYETTKLLPEATPETGTPNDVTAGVSKVIDTYTNNMKLFREGEAKSLLGLDNRATGQYTPSQMQLYGAEGNVSKPPTYPNYSNQMKLFREGETKSNDYKNYKPDTSALFTGLIQSLTTKLNLVINNTTNLVVDGKTLATVVKPYLKNDLVRYTGGGSGRTVNVI